MSTFILLVSFFFLLCVVCACGVAHVERCWVECSGRLRQCVSVTWSGAWSGALMGVAWIVFRGSRVWRSVWGVACRVDEGDVLRVGCASCCARAQRCMRFRVRVRGELLQSNARRGWTEHSCWMYVEVVTWRWSAQLSTAFLRKCRSSQPRPLCAQGKQAQVPCAQDVFAHELRVVYLGHQISRCKWHHPSSSIASTLTLPASKPAIGWQRWKACLHSHLMTARHSTKMGPHLACPAWGRPLFRGVIRLWVWRGRTRLWAVRKR